MEWCHPKNKRFPDHTALCRLNCPDDASFVSRYGKQRPLHSFLFLKTSTKWLTNTTKKITKNHDSKRKYYIRWVKCLCKRRCTYIFVDIQSTLNNRSDCIVFQLNKKGLHKRSKIFKLGFPLFLLEFSDNFSLVAYHNDTVCIISSLTTIKLKLLRK